MSLSEWTFEVFGQPRPKGSYTTIPRAGAHHIAAGGHRFYRARDMLLLPGTDKRLKAWTNAIERAARAASPAIPDAPVAAPWFCAAVFWFEPPKSRRAERWACGSKRDDAGATGPTGDIDKLTRGVLDALTGIFWPDDRYVVYSRQAKFYATDRPPGASIQARLIDRDPTFLCT